jgi:hypothetical protein
MMHGGMSWTRESWHGFCDFSVGDAFRSPGHAPAPFSRRLVADEWSACALLWGVLSFSTHREMSTRGGFEISRDRIIRTEAAVNVSRIGDVECSGEV